MTTEENKLQSVGSKFNRENIVITKETVRQEWNVKHKQESREEVRSRRAEFYMEKWTSEFPEYSYINYAALLELANRSDRVGKWFARVDAEFNAALTFPEWAAKGLTEKDTMLLQEKFRRINAVNRKGADTKRRLSEKFKQLNKDIDLQIESDLNEAYDGDEKAFVLTYPKGHLPIYHLISIVANSDNYVTWRRTNPTPEEIDKRPTPSDYENNLLDSFKKEMWNVLQEGGDLKEFLKEKGILFYIPSSTVGPGHLNSITKVLA